MLTPMDTAILKHQPDHLMPLTQAERDAGKLPPKRPTFREFVARVFNIPPRHPVASVPAHSAKTAACARSVKTCCAAAKSLLRSSGECGHSASMQQI
jgi:hypothetical protein